MAGPHGSRRSESVRGAGSELGTLSIVRLAYFRLNRRSFSDFVALVFEFCGHGVVAGTRQYSAQVDKLLSVDVLVTRTPENLGLLADAEQKHVVVLLFDGSDRLEQ